MTAKLHAFCKNLGKVLVRWSGGWRFKPRFGQFLFFTQQKCISEKAGKLKTVYVPVDQVSRLVTPGLLPWNSHPSSPSPQEPPVESNPPPEDQSTDVPVKGSSIQLVGPTAQPMWAMSTSFARPGGDGDTAKDRFSKITTPRILELDVNRMLIGQNTVRWVGWRVPISHLQVRFWRMSGTTTCLVTSDRLNFNSWDYRQLLCHI